MEADLWWSLFEPASLTLELQLEDKEEAEKAVAVAVAAATKAAKRLDFFIGMVICLEFKLLKFCQGQEIGK